VGKYHIHYLGRESGKDPEPNGLRDNRTYDILFCVALGDLHRCSSHELEEFVGV
jgi:hypothetical protein